ncbi:unnamed protein product [Lactuca saligna]|uniref:Uncharacterized protein n=1 Tax=Lactuca saligna TaxID=75948 RepID=A0AA35Z6A8_LACSI|nr:unnamed protein product [Lactuca saligna]
MYSKLHEHRIGPRIIDFIFRPRLPIKTGNLVTEKSEVGGVRCLVAVVELEGEESGATGLPVVVIAVVKIEEDEDESVYAFVSTLNLQRYKDCKCIMEMKEFLLSKCQEKEIKENLKSYFGEKAADVGLLI